MKVHPHSINLLRKTGARKTQCVHPMRLRKFIPHERLPDIQVDMNDEPDFFQDETPQLKPTTVAVSSDTEESDHENPQEIIIHLEPRTKLSPAIENSVHTTLSPPESQHDPVLNFPPKNIRRATNRTSVLPR